MLRAKPEDLPTAPLAMWVSVLAAFVSGTVGLLALYSFSGSLVRSLAGLAIAALFLYAVLALHRKQNRFSQSFCALCGSSTIIYLLALPLMPLMVPDPEQGYSPIVMLIVLALDIWTLLISAHIFRHALDMTFGRGLSMALFLMLATLLVIGQFSDPNAAVTEQGSLQQPLQ